MLAESYLRRDASAPGRSGSTSFCGFAYAYDPLVVPADASFVLGDDRDSSQDSRHWGFVKRDKIKGKALVIYWSWDSDRHGLRGSRLGRRIS